MVYFRVDDTIVFHPRIVAAGNAAAGVWMRCGAYCQQHLTDGRIPKHVARQIGSAKEIASLLKVGLWIEDGDDYVFHRWDAGGRQVSREQVEAKRKADRERVAAAREAASQKRVARDSHASRELVASTHSTPLHSMSSSEDSEGASTPPPRKRGTRIPDPFVVNGEMRSWAAAEVPGLDVNRVTTRFVDYWRGVSGAKASKVDWPATWRNWLREDFEKNPPKTPATAAPFVPKPFTPRTETRS